MTTILEKEIQMILDVDPRDRTPDMIYELGILLDQRSKLEKSKSQKN